MDLLEVIQSFYFFAVCLYTGFLGVTVLELVRDTQNNSPAYMWAGSLAALVGMIPLVLHIIDVEPVNESFPTGPLKWFIAAGIFACGLPIIYLHRRRFPR